MAVDIEGDLISGVAALGIYSVAIAASPFTAGAFSGVLAPVSAGMGGAVGKTVANRLSVEAVKQIGKEGIKA